MMDIFNWNGNRWERSTKPSADVTREDIINTYLYHTLVIGKYENWLDLGQCVPEDLNDAHRRLREFNEVHGVTQEEVDTYFYQKACAV